MSGTVNVIVALMPEAEPLIEHLGLKPVKGGPYKHFQGENINLVISGLGSDLAAAACGYLVGLGKNPPAGWLNVGIGGHENLPLGTLIIADEVVDFRGSIQWPMPLEGLPDLQTSKVTTYFQPEPRYPANTVCDMESAGFVAACRRLTGPGGIAVLKVVSDNMEHPTEEITVEMASKLIGDQLPEIESVIQALQAMTPKASP